MAKSMGVIFSTGLIGLIGSKGWALLLFLLVGLLCGKAAGGVLYYHSDFVQSSNVVTSSEGDVLQVLTYSPFGEVSQVSSQGSTPLLSRFATYEADPEAALFYAEARYYDPTTARFLSADPLRDFKNPADLNLYSYAWNRPLTKRDPSGQSEEGVENEPVVNLLVGAVRAYSQDRTLNSLQEIKNQVLTAQYIDLLREGWESIQEVEDPEVRQTLVGTFNGAVDAFAVQLAAELRADSEQWKERNYWHDLKFSVGAALGIGSATGGFYVLESWDRFSGVNPKSRYERITGLKLTIIRQRILRRALLLSVVGASVTALVSVGAYWVVEGPQYMESRERLQFGKDVLSLMKEIDATFPTTIPQRDPSQPEDLIP